MAESANVGVLGATCSVGQYCLRGLVQRRHKIFAFSRKIRQQSNDDVEWRCLGGADNDLPVIPYWLCVAPIWVLPEYFQILTNSGVRRIVVLSSTSRFTKEHSTDRAERLIAERLTSAEAEFQVWAAASDIQWVILRPTLIYGAGRDKNVSEIARFIRRYKVFPLLGQAKGLRQPVYVADVASACVSVLFTPGASNKSYNLSGAEILTYREMVARIFIALNYRPLFFQLPLIAIRLCLVLLRLLPRYRSWSFAMFDRMNQDLTFDHSDAEMDFGFSPQKFEIEPEVDLP